MFRNKAARHVWSEYMSLMKGEKREEKDNGYNIKYKGETTILSLAKIYSCIMTVLHCLGSEENRGGNRQKLYVEKFQSFLPIAMRQITWTLYKFLEERGPDDFVIAPYCPDSFEKCGEEENAMERLFRKKYNA